MDVEILYQPGNAAAKLRLAAGETCTAEAGALVAMDGSLEVATTTHKKSRGGILRGVKRLLAGESFFLNHYSAGARGGEIIVASTLPGDMMAHQLQDENLIVQGGSYVASDSGIEIDLGWHGLKSLFSGEGIFWLHLKGRGKVVLSSFGAIFPVAVDGEHIVDSGHIVAFEETLDFTISKAGRSWIASFLGGEGLVCRFRGRGTLWCQSHNAPSFGRTLGPMLRPR
jgi:uncharacterized protein (TIGR00266 family)